MKKLIMVYIKYEREINNSFLNKMSTQNQEDRQTYKVTDRQDWSKRTHTHAYTHFHTYNHTRTLKSFNTSSNVTEVGCHMFSKHSHF